jgi:hypothetical protein
VSAGATLATVAMLALAGCRDQPAPAPALALRGPLAAHVVPAPASLDACTARDSAGVRIRECTDTLADGASRFVAVAPDSTVAEVTLAWLLGDRAREAAFARESTALARALGAPASARRPDAAARERDPQRAWRSECVAWRSGDGSDGIEAVLRLDPLVDLGPVRDSVDWRLTRWLRRGALPPAVACGL